MNTNSTPPLVIITGASSGIAPGMVGTELVSHATDEAAKAGWLAYAERIGGPLVPEDIAEAILYACQAPQRVCIREIVICPTKQQP